MSSKLNSVIEKLRNKSSQSPEKVEEVKEEDLDEDVEEAGVEEVKKEGKVDRKPSEEEIRQHLLARKIADLNQNGIFRMELLAMLDSIDTNGKVLNMVLMKALDIKPEELLEKSEK